MSHSNDKFCLDHPDNKGHSKSKRLKVLPSTDSQFLSVEKLFNNGWKHPKKKQPKIHAIFRILSSSSTLRPYTAYRTRVGSSPTLRGHKENPGNEQLLFHGTNRFCSLGEDSSNVRLCHLSKCHLCAVIRNSFDINKCGTKNKFCRFGTGIYTTACSSKADDYSANGEQKCRFRVLLVSRVVVGNPYKRRYNAIDLAEPPCGHHSVVGEPGGDLNYEETVVYDNDAIRPAFVIVYGEPPAIKLNFRDLIANLFKTPLAS